MRLMANLPLAAPLTEHVRFFSWNEHRAVSVLTCKHLIYDPVPTRGPTCVLICCICQSWGRYASLQLWGQIFFLSFFLTPSDTSPLTSILASRHSSLWTVCSSTGSQVSLKGLCELWSSSTSDHFTSAQGPFNLWSVNATRTSYKPKTLCYC